MGGQRNMVGGVPPRVGVAPSTAGMVGSSAHRPGGGENSCRGHQATITPRGAVRV